MAEPDSRGKGDGAHMIVVSDTCRGFVCYMSICTCGLCSLAGDKWSSPGYSEFTHSPSLSIPLCPKPHRAGFSGGSITGLYTGATWLHFAHYAPRLAEGRLGP